MKKYIICSMLASIVALSSCGTTTSEIQSAKKDLLGDVTLSETSENIQDNALQGNDVMESQDTSLAQIKALTENQFIQLDTIENDDVNEGEVIITGKALSDVERIDVLFENVLSVYPDDDYTLQAFSPGDEIFKYIASSKNKVLDYGTNVYTFVAYNSDNVVSKTSLTINVLDKDNGSIIVNEDTGIESQLVGTESDSILLNLPTSTKYGEPLRLGEASFTYTQIKGLEIQKQILGELHCEGVTEYLQEQISTWFYWNTCRDIVKDQGIKFNVIRLDGERYVYERHYVDYTKGLYGVYELEVGEGVDSDTIADKNRQLKEKEFPTLEIVDDLMRDISIS